MSVLNFINKIDIDNQYNPSNKLNVLGNLTYAKQSISNFDVKNFQRFNGVSTSIPPRYNNLQQDTTSKTKNKIGAVSLGDLVAGAGVDALTGVASNYISNKLFDDSEVGRSMGALFSSGIGAAGNTLSLNLLKGSALTENLGLNVGSALGGTAMGIAGNYIGQGINSLGGDTRLSRGIGQGVASTIGIVGSDMLNGNKLYNSIKTLKQAHNYAKGVKGATEVSKASQMASKANLWGAGMSIAGSAIGAAAGPSKEYGGKYGNYVKTADTVYDVITAGVNFIPGWGLVVSGALALNKGLGNIFGSTDGMTMQDAILGSAFTPAPFKWLNMANAKTTDTFGNQSWQNSEKVGSFMQNSFGNLNDKFDKARAEAGKTYGTFSNKAYNKALDNLNFANYAWNKVLDMADLNELQNIRSQYMSSINNQRYALNILGGWSPIARGKQGMKIFNNATNHNIGMRLLSAAALIDNKQMILCNALD